MKELYRVTDFNCQQTDIESFSSKCETSWDFDDN